MAKAITREQYRLVLDLLRSREITHYDIMDLLGTSTGSAYKLIRELRATGNAYLVPAATTITNESRLFAYCGTSETAEAFIACAKSNGAAECEPPTPGVKLHLTPDDIPRPRPRYAVRVSRDPLVAAIFGPAGTAA